jgi:hypothetical protein
MRGYVEWLESQERDGLGTSHEDWIESHLEKADAARDEETDESTQ